MGSLGPVLSALALTFVPAVADAACAPDTVELRGPSGLARFHVELADEPAEQAKGLMFREKLAASAGMLFVFPAPKHASFWMKNTLIPLDMIFADAAGRVTHVHAMAVPGAETPIVGGEGVAMVLEINGGLAARLGIAPGSELRHPSVEQSGAAWPCD
ncbi:DUF192 domain-containing protein [Paracoccaceae bacterium]